MYELVDKFKRNAKTRFEKNIAKSLINNFGRGKYKQNI